MNRTVLVTGGAGYIGSHMVKALRGAGHRVVVIDNLSRGFADAVPEGLLVVADLLDAAALDRLFTEHSIDVVMHFAALAYVGESMQHPRLYYHNNVQGALNLIHAMLDHGVDKLVFSSTCATYGVPDEIPITEQAPQRPINPYGRSKLMIEQVLADYASACGLNSVSLRYFNAAGCDAEGELGERHDPETHLIPLVLQEAARVLDGGEPADTTLAVFGDDFDTPDGSCVRDYIHVEDLCAAHLAAMERLCDGEPLGAEAYNLGNGNGFSVFEVIDVCRRVTGAPIDYRVSPRRPGDPPALVGSAARAKEVLGWQPSFTALDQIIDTAWQWMCQQR